MCAAYTSSVVLQAAEPFTVRLRNRRGLKQLQLKTEFAFVECPMKNKAKQTRDDVSNPHPSEITSSR